MKRAIEAPCLQPIAGATIPLAEATETFALTKRGDHVAKIVSDLERQFVPKQW